MFSTDLLQGWGESPDAEKDASVQDDSREETASGPGFSFWSVAAAVTSNVRKQAAELVSSVAETDWKHEITNFSKEVSQDTQVLGSNALHMVDHIPNIIEHLPEQAEKALPNVAAHGKDVGHTLEAVGTSITQFGRSLLIGGKEIIEQVKDAVETEIAAASKQSKRGGRPPRNSPAGSSTSRSGGAPAKYSRFDAEVSAMQRDSSTYCDEPEDREEYDRWRASFRLEGAQGDIERITRDNPFMAELQARIVPLIVEHDDFWHRYFYRLHKLQQKEEQRQHVAQMANAMPSEEEELAWDDDLEEVDRVIAEAEQEAATPPIPGGAAAASETDSADIEAEMRDLVPSPEPEPQQTAARQVAPQEVQTPPPTLRAPGPDPEATPLPEEKAAPSTPKAPEEAPEEAAPAAEAHKPEPSSPSKQQQASPDSAAIAAAAGVAALSLAAGGSAPEAHPEAALDKQESMGGSDTSKEWSIVSGEASVPAVPTDVEHGPAEPSAAPATPTGAAASPAAATPVADSIAGATAEKADKPEKHGEDEDEDDDALLEDLGEDDGEDDGEEVDEDWGSWN